MKSLNHVRKEVVDKTGIAEDKVKKVMSEYWATFYSEIIEANHCTLFPRGIGVFTVSRTKLYNYIRKKIGSIRKATVSTEYTEEMKAKVLDNMYSKLRRALKYRDLLAVEYQKKFKKYHEQRRKKSKGLSNGSKKRNKKQG